MPTKVAYHHIRSDEISDQDSIGVTEIANREFETPSPGTIQIALEPLEALTSLEADWNALQVKSDHSFFLSWGWIGAWIQHLPADREAFVATARSDGNLVGLGIIVEGTVARHGILRSRCAILHEFANERLDKLMIEHNGFLMQRGTETMVLAAFCQFFADHLAKKRWDEVVLPGVSAEYTEKALATGVCVDIRRDAPSHIVDLAAIRSSEGDYLVRLGRKTRQAVRRSLRYYETLGKVEITQPATVEEALVYYEKMIELHLETWAERNEPSAFDDPWFVDFHRTLIEDRFEEGEIQLLRATAGGHLIGIMYHFVYGERVYSYQWGLSPQEDPNIKYGLIADYLAVLYNLDKAVNVFDFLHGDTLHKRRLSTEQDSRQWIVLQRDRLSLKLESMARRFKRAMK